jgi:hypothetical protein
MLLYKKLLLRLSVWPSYHL